jgi:hypothetical protein
MYYVFEAEIAGENDLTYADAVGEMPNFLSIAKEWSWWSHFPLPVPFPKTTFSIDENIYQDAYQTGSIFDLHSEKLADLIRASGTRCEYFPVEMVSRKSSKAIPSKYFAFHLMETYSAIDYARSTLIEDAEPVPKFILKARASRGNPRFWKRIVTLELTEEVLSRQRPMFRDKEIPRRVFVHEALKQRFDLSGIKGCEYTHYKDFRDLTVSDLFEK